MVRTLHKPYRKCADSEPQMVISIPSGHGGNAINKRRIELRKRLCHRAKQPKHHHSGTSGNVRFAPSYSRKSAKTTRRGLRSAYMETPQHGKRRRCPPNSGYLQRLSQQKRLVSQENRQAEGMTGPWGPSFPGATGGGGGRENGETRAVWGSDCGPSSKTILALKTIVALNFYFLQNHRTPDFLAL